MIEGSCHCGAIRVEVPCIPAQLTSCNCSICRRLGMLMAYYRAEEVTIVAGPDAQMAYIWGDQGLAFKRCGTCGCTTHWESLDAQEERRIGVNARIFEPSVVARTRVRRFDGADTWAFLD